jgi:hypothetical protein
MPSYRPKCRYEIFPKPNVLSIRVLDVNPDARGATLLFHITEGGQTENYVALSYCCKSLSYLHRLFGDLTLANLHLCGPIRTGYENACE